MRAVVLEAPGPPEALQIRASRYYITRALIGQQVSLQIDATDRTFVVHEGQKVKRIAIAGTLRGRVPFAQFVELLCE